MAIDGSFIDQIESVVDDVSDWAVETVDRITKALSPDGRPFDEVKKTKAQLMAEYMELRGNPEAWVQWIDSKVVEIMTYLTGEGIDQEYMAGVHPYSIAISYAIDYSARMERMLMAENE